MKIKVSSSIMLSLLIIATSAVFSLTVIPSVARADDSGEIFEQCFTDSNNTLGKCSCSEYTCHTYTHVVGGWNIDNGFSRAGMGCFIGDSQISVWGNDTSVNNNAAWGDPANCANDIPLAN